VKYILDLTKSDVAYGNHSLAVLRLVKVGVPSVINPFCFTPQAFEDFMKLGELPEELISDLSDVYDAITVDGYKANIRTPDVICEEFPSLSYQLNLKMQIFTKEDFIESFRQRFQTIKEAIEEHDLKKVELAGLLQSTYDSLECGLTQSDDGYGNIRIEAAFGQNTNIISREGVDADIYIVRKSDLEILDKKIGKKEKQYWFTENGSELQPVPEERQNLQVFTDEQIKTFADYAQRLENEYGPQEFECAITTEGILLVQDSRDMERIVKEESSDGVEIIFPGNVEGEILSASSIEDLPSDCSGSIVLVNSLSLDLITLLIYKYKPRAIVLTVGTLTSHASTILRESQIPSYIINNIDLEDGKRVLIKEDGSHELLT
jgi:phosphohistidine swiveling domain-containing protein